MNNMEEVAKIIGVDICKKFETRGACGEFVLCKDGLHRVNKDRSTKVTKEDYLLRALLTGDIEAIKELKPVEEETTINTKNIKICLTDKALTDKVANLIAEKIMDKIKIVF